MVEETDKIKQHIDKEREILGRNLDEIEFRVKDATDAKAIFNRNTGWILGAAVAGGFLLSLTFGKSSAPTTSTTLPSNPKEHEIRKPTPSARFASTHLSHVSETVDNIFAGLVGVFSDKLQAFVADAVPGFREQYDGINRRDHSPVQQMRSTVER